MNSHREYLSLIKQQFQKLNISVAEAEDIFMYCLSATLEDILFDNLQLTHSSKHMIDSMVTRRISGEPLAYIIGQREFFGRTFLVNHHTLIPRNDTEVLVYETLKRIRNALQTKQIKVLDLGTGTGCILLSILAELRNDGYDVSGVGIDISQGAIDIAKQNAERFNLQHVTHFICNDWNNLSLKSDFNVIVSNPPYIPMQDISNLEVSVKNYEPHTALNGGESGFNCYKNILLLIQKMQLKHSIVGFEFGIGQGDEMLKLMRNFYNVKIEKDLNKIERVIISEIYPNI